MRRISWIVLRRASSSEATVGIPWNSAVLFRRPVEGCEQSTPTVPLRPIGTGARCLCSRTAYCRDESGSKGSGIEFVSGKEATDS